MDSDSIYRSITLIVLIIAGGLLAGMETAYSSCNKIRLKHSFENGDAKSGRALFIIEQFDKSITTVLILVNIIHIAAASVATVLAIRLMGEIGSLVSTIVVTILVFTFSEVIPKSIAKDNADAYARSFAPLLTVLVIVLTPLSYLFSAAGRAIRKLTGPKTKEMSMTEDELQSMIESIEEEGVLESDQSELIQSAIDFLDTTAQDIVTHRMDMVAIDIDWSEEKKDKMILSEKYSRLPVYEDTVDNVIGILQTRKYLKNMFNNQKTDIRSVMDKPIFVHQSMLLNTLFEMMSSNRTHMVVVTDDYGGTLGIITIEDIMEELVGDIYDEDDIVETEYSFLENGTMIVSGKMHMDDFFDVLDMACPDETLEHRTVSAWTMEHLQNIPQVNDSFCASGLCVTILSIDGMRIEELSVAKMPDEQPQNEIDTKEQA